MLPDACHVNPIAAAAEHIRANCAPGAPPLVPELRMHLLRDDAPLRATHGDELFAEDGPRPYWAFAWIGGQVLARLLLDHPTLVRDRRVYDLGAGGAMGALAAARCGAVESIAVDIDPVALCAARLNAQLNELHITTSDVDFQHLELSDDDIVLAGDIAYRPIFGQWMQGLRHRPVLVLVGDPGRGTLPTDMLRRVASWPVRAAPDIEHESLHTGHVYQLMNAAPPIEV